MLIDQKNPGAVATWTSTIKPQAAWFNVDFRELWRYRDLVRFFVWRDFVACYKQTILGPVWFIVQPLTTTIVFTVIFGKIARVPTDGIPQFVFYMSGVVPWTYFASCLDKTSTTFVNNAGIFGKVYFPRLVVPISIVITNLITFAIQFILFMGVLTYFCFSGAAVHPNWLIAFTPFLLLQMAALGLGTGILISSLTTKYRDLAFVVGFGVQLWMYATPIVYPVSQVPEAWRWLYFLNPMAGIIETFRYAFLGAGTIDGGHILLSAGMTIVILFVGVILFSRIEKTFMDTI